MSFIRTLSSSLTSFSLLSRRGPETANTGQLAHTQSSIPATAPSAAPITAQNNHANTSPVPAQTRQPRTNHEASAANALRRHLHSLRVEPLCEAVEAGDLHEVQRLLASGSIDPSCSRDPEVAGDKEGTPLHLAMVKGHCAIAAALLDDPRVQFKPTAKDYGQVHEQLAQLLREDSPQPNRLRMLQTLLRHPKINPNWQDENGQTLLHAAVTAGGFKETILLLDPANRPNLPKTDPNVANNAGFTPLHVAAEGNDPRIVRRLLSAGAHNIPAHLSTGWSILTPLSIAINRNHSGIVAELVTAGADVNSPITTDGDTPLSMAISNDNHDIVAALLQRADVNAPDGLGQTPLCLAVYLRMPEIMTMVLNAGADVNQPGFLRQTPLFLAAQYGHFDMVNELLDKQADVNLGNYRGETPLIIAVKNGRAETIAKLAEVADVNQADERGMTPLIHAAENGDYQTVDILLERGADPARMAKDGWTAFSVAQKAGHEEVCMLLLEAGATPPYTGSSTPAPHQDAQQIQGLLPYPPLDPALYLSPKDYKPGDENFLSSNRGERKQRGELPKTDMDSEDEIALVNRQERRLLELPQEGREYLKSIKAHFLSQLVPRSSPESSTAIVDKFNKDTILFSVPLVSSDQSRKFYRGLAIPRERLNEILSAMESDDPQVKRDLGRALMHGSTHEKGIRHGGITSASTLPAIADRFRQQNQVSLEGSVGIILEVMATGGPNAARGVTARKSSLISEGEVILDPSNQYTPEDIQWDAKKNSYVIKINASNPNVYRPLTSRPPLSSTDILGTELTGTKGSNQGGLYQGLDGVKRYVKFYKHPSQVYGEAVANRILRDLQLGAPDSTVFLHRFGKPAYASTFIESAKPFSPDDKESAKTFFSGFAADVLMMNWDVLGQNHDNILKDENEKLVRVDNGSAFLHRAQGAYKPENQLHELTELDGFFNPQLNPSYAKLAAAAGYAKVEDIPDIKQQVQAIVDLRNRYGGWDKYVAKQFPEWQDDSQKKIIEMLTIRTLKLQERFGLFDVHGQQDDAGRDVVIRQPTQATPNTTWFDPDAIAIFTPRLKNTKEEDASQNKVPKELNDIAMHSWVPPATTTEWNKVEGQMPGIDEEHPFQPHAGGKQSAAGAVIMEPDGRIWLVEPTNHFGGYVATFPKGRLDPGLSMQATAIKEAYEETGLKIELHDLLGDFEGDTTKTRYYLAKRTAGTPNDMGWESQSASLVPLKTMAEPAGTANTSDNASTSSLEIQPEFEPLKRRDQEIIAALQDKLNAHKTATTPQ